MRWFIRRVVRKGRDAVSFEDDIHFGPELTIGRGTDQAIYLPDLRAALAHARVTLVGKRRYKVESLVIAGIRVDGTLVQEVVVSPGARIEIGSLLLKLEEPGEGQDARIEVSTIDRDEQRARAEAARLPTRLAETWLSKRRPSWLLFVAIATLGLGLPAASHFHPQLDQLLRRTALPSLLSWQAGELAAAHHRLGADCKYCHVDPFVPTQDVQCLACHAGTPAHADPTQFDLPRLASADCAHCHRDHNGPKGLILAAQRLCADCHGNLSERSGGLARVADASDFGRHHPEFSIELPGWDAEGRWAPQRVRMDQPALLIERSGLKFPHDLHLSADGINSPSGRRRLECASCHAMQPGGGLMQPVDFETMCQDCHRLAFDTQYPDRQVPHARVPEVLFMLEEFYARRALEGGYADQNAPTVVRERRRPGQPLSRQEQIELLAWARERARRVAEGLFTGRACATCHEVSPGPDAGQPWRIAPVRVAGSWFPKHDFSHVKHRTMACSDCHAAERSASSADVLMPDIANCRQCHGGESARDRVQSTCIACHGYHRAPQRLQATLPLLAQPSNDRRSSR